MHIFVGSTNPVKVNSVVDAANETWPDVQVQGFSVPSGIAEQPMSDQETKRGAINRAQAVLAKGLDQLKISPENLPKEIDPQNNSQEYYLGVGLEGGVFQTKPNELWSTVWAVVTDHTGHISAVNGARFRVPDRIAKPILDGGEMGPVVGQLYKDPQLKQKQGAIGIVTQGFINRTEEYSSLAKLALGLWYGQNWDKNL